MKFEMKFDNGKMELAVLAICNRDCNLTKNGITYYFQHC
jgi:hypothetical protein